MPELKGWQLSTFLAFEGQKSICPVCGKRMQLTSTFKDTRMVGHHLRSRKYGDDSPSNCVARHSMCEQWCHQASPDGNPTDDQLRLYRMRLEQKEK